MLSLEDAKENLRIDEDDDGFDTLINSYLEESKAIIESSTGVPDNFETFISDEYSKDKIDSLYTMCQRILITDTWYERDTTNRALNSYYTKLELSYRRFKN